MQENKDNEKFLDSTKSKVQNVTDLYCSIEDKIKDRITLVQTALYRCQGFNEALDDFERWLFDTEGRLQALGTLSIKPSVIKKQGSGLKVTIPFYINLLMKGSKLRRKYRSIMNACRPTEMSFTWKCNGKLYKEFFGAVCMISNIKVSDFLLSCRLTKLFLYMWSVLRRLQCSRFQF